MGVPPDLVDDLGPVAGRDGGHGEPPSAMPQRALLGGARHGASARRPRIFPLPSRDVHERRGTPVRAAVYDRYGPPDVLRIDDVPVPSPAAGTGAGQGRRDVGQPAATGSPCADRPRYARIGGLRSPGAPDARLGHRRVGSRPSARASRGSGPATRCTATTWRCMGGFAEYAVAAESALAHKPAGLTFAAGVDDPAGRARSRCRAPSAPPPGAGCWSTAAAAGPGRSRSSSPSGSART